MQKGPDWKGTGLVPISTKDTGETGEQQVVHVFGMNLEKRVITSDNNQDDLSATLASQIESSNNKAESTNQANDEDIETIKKRKFEAITGEEDEKTVFQGEFKLFCWDIQTSNWKERGRGQLKLNDCGELGKKKSRLIMRIGGTLKIVLNVSLNQPHFRVIVGSKTSIRFTDGQNLWAAGGNNALQLKELIEERLLISRKATDLDNSKKVKSTLDQEPTSSATTSTTSASTSASTSSSVSGSSNTSSSSDSATTRTSESPTTQKTTIDPTDRTDEVNETNNTDKKEDDDISQKAPINPKEDVNRIESCDDKKEEAESDKDDSSSRGDDGDEDGQKAESGDSDHDDSNDDSPDSSSSDHSDSEETKHEDSKEGKNDLDTKEKKLQEEQEVDKETKEEN